MTDTSIAPSACNIQVSITTTSGVIGVVSTQLNSGEVAICVGAGFFLHVA